ncbi:MAG: hypothetical protein KAR57_01415 [Bacteroidales bacterium]|nr:hypothetical protein [Bacteroidales bacterium]
MFQEKSDNTSTATVKQAEKSPKEKTMSTSHMNSLATIDITQATTLEEQAIIMQNNLENPNSASAFTDNIESYFPGKYQEHVVVNEDQKKEEEKPKHEIGDAAKDKEFMKKVFSYTVNLKGAVGKGQNNDKEDVKLVAAKLNELGYENVPQKCIDKGEWDDGLTTNIKNFQNFGGEGYYARRNYKELNKFKGIVGTNDATFKAMFRNSGLDAIFMNRSSVDSKIDIGKTKIEGDVGKDKTNNPEDVKLVAELLVENEIENVPEVCLEQGLWHDDLEKSIGAFLPNQTWIGHNGNNIKKLTKKRKSQGTLKVMNYDMSTQEHSPSETRADYDKKMDKIQEGMGIKEGDDYSIVLEIANKAATDPEYFTDLTKDIGEKLTNIASKRKDGDVTLSPVLEDRLSRFHKFMVATGLYDGNMFINDGARSPQRAHRWSVEWVIESPKAKSKYKQAVKANLIKMYDDETWHDGIYIKDKDDNYWAKKDHFYSYIGPIDPEFKTKKEYDDYKKVKRLEYKGKPKTGILWDDVVLFVKEYSDKVLSKKKDGSYRNDSSAAASEGYSDALMRMPNMAGAKPNVTNHKTGEAIDINSKKFVMKTDAIIDLIALQFGLVRDANADETWHFEMTGVEVTKENEKYLKETESKK